jgi:hypothetical protein
MYVFKVCTDAMSEDYLYNKLKVQSCNPTYKVQIECWNEDDDYKNKKTGYQFMLYYEVKCIYWYYDSTQLNDVELIDVDTNFSDYPYKKILQIITEYSDDIVYEFDDEFYNTMLINLKNKIYEKAVNLIKKQIKN